MKKFVAIMIAAAMLLTLSVSAFAGTITTNGGSENRDVTGVFAQPTDKAIYVTVSWGDMKSKYTPDTQELKQPSPMEQRPDMPELMPPLTRPS